MINSKYYLKKTVQERFEFLAISIVLAGILSVFLLPVLWKLGLISYSVVVVFVIIFMVANTHFFRESKYSEKAKEEFSKEELIRTFHTSPNYYRYVKSQVDDTDEFINVMSKIVASFMEIDELDVFYHALTGCSHSDHIKETIIYLLINPQILNGKLDLISALMNETEVLIEQYPYAVNPYTITKNVHPDHVPNMNIREIKGRLHDILGELLDTLGDITEDYKQPTITDINDFLKIIEFKAGSQGFKL